MFSRCITGVTLALLMAAAPAFSQSLADVARAEEARRGTAKKATKSYSNADLGPGGVREEAAPEEAGEESCFKSKETGKCAPAEQVIANSAGALKVVEDAPKEAPIRSEADTIRGELARVQAEIDSFQAQEGNASLPVAKRQAATEALRMRRISLDGFQRRWARLERQVKEHNLPHAWIEPVPGNVKP